MKKLGALGTFSRGSMGPDDEGANVIGAESGCASNEAKVDKHPEATCQRCKGPNVVWFVANNVWNQVMKSESGVLCPVCFVTEAGKQGVDCAWKLSPEIWEEVGS